MHLVDPQPTRSTFTTTELARLAAYRAAVAAGFFSDWDGSATSTDSKLLGWLLHGAGSAAAGSYPFTVAERQALEAMRARVAGGAFADDQPEVAVAPAVDGS